MSIAGTTPQRVAVGTRSWIDVRLTAWCGLAVATLIAAASRLPELGKDSLNLNEGFTLLYERQSWRAVLGFDGFYTPHPPLFFTLVKLADLVSSEIVASRIVAVTCGIAGIAVFYALVARLFDDRAALASSIILILSPIHLFYSRTGKMYVPVSLAVAASYLGLVAFLQTSQRRWAVLYGVGLAVAPWLDYSAAYALAPQALLFAFAVWQRRRASLPLLAAAVAAFVAYLPWLPQVFATVDRLRDDPTAANRATFVPSWAALNETVPVLMGLEGYGTPGRVGVLTFWDRWDGAHGWLLLATATALVVGLVASWQRLGGVVGALLAVGTVVAAIGASLISPGFETRTVLAAVMGWAILTGAVFARAPMPVALRAVGIAGWCFIAVASGFGLPRIYEYGSRNPWPEVANDLAGQAHLGKPLIVYSYGGIVTDLIDVYADGRLAGIDVVTVMSGATERSRGGERWLDRGLTLEQVRAGALADLLPPDDPSNDAVWFTEKFGGQEVARYLAGLGYERLTTVKYYKVALDLYARPNANLGSLIEINGTFTGDEATGWTISANGYRLEPDRDSPRAEDRVLVLGGEREQLRARYSVDGVPPGLYSVETWAGAHTPDTVAQFRLRCLSATGLELLRFSKTDEGGAVEGDWHPLRAAILCPAGTTSLDVELWRRGPADVAFRDVLLTGSPSIDPRGREGSA